MRRVVEVGEGFYNIRGSFKIAGILNVGTHMSLVRLSSGKFVLLDSIAPDAEVRAFLDDKTRGGDDLEAILNLHPFHTVYVRRLHEAYPNAKLYGTSRHHERLRELPWEPLRTEDPALHEQFAGDLAFSVPRGVELVPENENLHFSSVLAFHAASRTLHVDDTLNYVRLPAFLRRFDFLRFHPSLAQVLERRAGAASDFRAWAQELIERARSVENVCAAHTTVLIGRDAGGPPVAERVADALRRVERKLAAHERRSG